FAAIAGANAQTVISQTNGVAPTDSTVACAVGNPATGISASSYFRAYQMSSDFVIGSVRIGAGSVTGEFPATVKLYTSSAAFPGSYPSGLTEVAVVTSQFTDSQDLTLVDFELDSPVSVSAGTFVVIELSNPNTTVAEGGTGALHYMGIASTE